MKETEMVRLNIADGEWLQLRVAGETYYVGFGPGDVVVTLCTPDEAQEQQLEQRRARARLQDTMDQVLDAQWEREHQA